MRNKLARFFYAIVIQFYSTAMMFGFQLNEEDESNLVKATKAYDELAPNAKETE